MIDYQTDTIVIEGVTYPLDELRKYLLKHHEPLCTNSFIKCITVLGRKKFTYDWSFIFEVAEESGYIKEFHKRQCCI